MTLLLKSQFLYKLQTFKNQGKQILLMNKIGKWIEANMVKFFKWDQHKSYDENEFKLRKQQNEIWSEGEKMINAQQFSYANTQKEKIKSMLQKHKTYNEKVVFIDKKIEDDLLFFKNSYMMEKKQMYQLRQ